MDFQFSNNATQKYIVLTKIPSKSKASKNQNIMNLLIYFKMMETRMVLPAILLKITIKIMYKVSPACSLQNNTPQIAKRTNNTQTSPSVKTRPLVTLTPRIQRQKETMGGREGEVTNDPADSREANPIFLQGG